LLKLAQYTKEEVMGRVVSIIFLSGDLKEGDPCSDESCDGILRLNVYG